MHWTCLNNHNYTSNKYNQTRAEYTYNYFVFLWCLKQPNWRKNLLLKLDLNFVILYSCILHFITCSDNFWSAFCVFHAHFWGKTHSFKICALKNRIDFRQLKMFEINTLRILMHFLSLCIDYNEVISVQNRGEFIKVLEKHGL